MKDDMLSGKVYTTNNCGDLKIVKYHSARKVDVEFLATGYCTTTKADHIRSGSVKDKRYPSVFGRGFYGEGTYKASVSGKLTKAGLTWKNMLRRCYCPKSLLEHPTYVGCSVSDDWLDFQVFAAWFEKNYIEGYELDKDTLVAGNKVYSEITCSFISKKDNSIAARAKNYTFMSPEGDVVEVYNLSSFCRDNNLNRANMGLVHSGNRKQHKGWTKPN